jgi:hypothetical protein
MKFRVGQLARAANSHPVLRLHQDRGFLDSDFIFMERNFIHGI